MSPDGREFNILSALHQDQQKSQGRPAQWSWSGSGARAWAAQGLKCCRNSASLHRIPTARPVRGSEPLECDLYEGCCAKMCSRKESRSISRTVCCGRNSCLCPSPFFLSSCTTRPPPRCRRPTPPPSSGFPEGPFGTEPGSNRWICQGDQNEPGPLFPMRSVSLYSSCKDMRWRCLDPAPVSCLKRKMKPVQLLKLSNVFIKSIKILTPTKK